MHLPLPPSASLIYAGIGGFEGAIALAIFYRALAMGAMGLTAALTGLLTALVPVLFSLIREGLPTPLTVAGLATGLAAIWLITHTPRPAAAENRVPHPSAALSRKGGRQQPSTLQPSEAKQDEVPHPSAASLRMGGKQTSYTPLLLGALAGLGFGTQLIFFKMANTGGILWAMTSARATGVLAILLVLAFMPLKGPWRGFWLTGIAAGTLDTLGNLFYIQASRVGRLDVAALVCSLYPAGTILLAAVLLREWPTRRQFAGIALALAAVALLSI
jgi:drug/metabolite transporter (DMT)-like permease